MVRWSEWAEWSDGQMVRWSEWSEWADGQMVGVGGVVGVVRWAGGQIAGISDYRRSQAFSSISPFRPLALSPAHSPITLITTLFRRWPSHSP